MTLLMRRPLLDEVVDEDRHLDLYKRHDIPEFLILFVVVVEIICFLMGPHSSLI